MNLSKQQIQKLAPGCLSHTSDRFLSIVLYSSIYIAPLNSHRQTEALIRDGLETFYSQQQQNLTLVLVFQSLFSANIK